MSEDTITQQELAEAFKRLGYTSQLHASKIFEDIKAHRELEWQPGDVVLDAWGTVWFKDVGNTWLRAGVAGVWQDDQVRRPLKLWTPKD